jgi:hypothetical protein
LAHQRADPGSAVALSALQQQSLQKKYGGTVGVTAVGMFGRGRGWGIPTAAHTLDITLGGIGEKAVRVFQR